jgi:hypothetical protein
LPDGHAHVDPQASSMPARDPSVGHIGAQHAFLYNRAPAAHGQVPPQASAMPASEPSTGHAGAQHAPL